MRIKLRLRWLSAMKACCFHLLALALLHSKTILRYVCLMFLAFMLLCLIWWLINNNGRCYEPQLQDYICREYNSRFLSGNLCHDMCVTKELRFKRCDDSSVGVVKKFKSEHLIFKVTDLPSWADRVREGQESDQFMNQVKRFLQQELGPFDTTSLIQRLIGDFDTNKDQKIDLGEAQNMWWMLKQPDFLNFYIFQDSTSVPYLNGTCGPVSVWYYIHLAEGSTLYRRQTPWPISLLISNAYRWTLPSWNWRAKVMLSLVELAEELYERNGVRFHLCNINGLSLYHHDTFEVVITEDSLLLSGQQIRNQLSNVTCNYAHDCTLTPQCQTTCEFSSKQCSDKVVRPTIAQVCDIMEDYILFDAPKILHMSLNRLIHRCQSISLYTQKLDLVHSILILDLKSLLWNYIQNKLK